LPGFKDCIIFAPMKLTKNILLFAFSFLFLISASGIVLIYHTCETCRQESVMIRNFQDYSQDEHDPCCDQQATYTNVEMSYKCCNETLSFVKLSDPYVNGFYKLQDSDTPSVSFFIQETHHSESVTSVFRIQRIFYPPDKSIKNIPLLNRTLRI
jgi:hypothetical protein